MCGIAGVVRANKEKLKVTPDQIKKTLVELEFRGPHATGVSWQDPDGKFWVLKTPARAQDFIELKSFQECLPEIVESPVILMHTRFATQGSPQNNHNNHPIHNNRGIIIHNGMITAPVKLKARGETDTEQIMLYIQRYGFKKGLEKIDGSMSIAYVNLENKMVYFYSETMPFAYFEDKDNEAVLFASTKTILKDGMGVAFDKSKSLPEKIVYRVDKNKHLVAIAHVNKPAKYYYQSNGASYYCYGDYGDFYYQRGQGGTYIAKNNGGLAPVTDTKDNPKLLEKPKYKDENNNSSNERPEEGRVLGDFGETLFD